MKPVLFILSVLFAYCVGMYGARLTRASEVPAAATAQAVERVPSVAVQAHPVTVTQVRTHARPRATPRQRPHSARSQRHAPEPTDYVVFAGTERYRELESTCDAYPGRCVRVGNTTIIQ